MESNKTRLKNKNKKKSEYKNRNMNYKNRFFPCFRPVTMDGPVRRERRANVPGEPVFTYIPAGEMNEGMVFPKIFPPVFAGDIDKKEVDCGRREKSANGRLSRIMKAVLSGRSLVSTLIVILVVPFSVYLLFWFLGDHNFTHSSQKRKRKKIYSVRYSVLWMILSLFVFMRFLDYIVVLRLSILHKREDP